ncbi:MULTISPECIES: NAD(P)/FAD-dependent oxidoreductase [Prauserella salsuginis group]|uniref:NAD(P)/FAD-dependent oxidoreductase n=1 Tax=Prauserella salsuginis TaxID=387889 RepID=A0ABW6G0V4_9PSEU|nr:MULTISPECIES: FAD-dependent oxidoreductase [Prauserella salsuginis group]MCR3721986.1 3-phenylpropionate/trans-cinnamate dioxygenase ferredoxin reductase subunit [Prauserella flava]MCR3735992.1 3-phenylpropionate/trans-cinnamate dioxygenase ferredoxin reductase subunit [Prauserella salsuginis]
MSPKPSSEPGVVVIGAGQAGVHVADALREGGYHGAVTIVGDEPGVPYERPPLSKGFLVGTTAPESLRLRDPEHFMKRRIKLRIGVAARRVDTVGRTVALADGMRLGYDHLVLATGAAPRGLPIPGSDLTGVCCLRTVADARWLRERMRSARSVVIVGGGFIGMEIAATTRGRGPHTTVLEAADRPLERALSPTMARHLVEAHRRSGVDVRLGERVTGLVGERGHVTGVVGASGHTYPADLVVVAIGVSPRAELAEAAGVRVADGILVDGSLRTTVPEIFAVGDCARHPNVHAGAMVRIESVQNATDQARHVADTILGTVDEPYARLPWFWSHQGELRLQIAGLRGPDEYDVVLGAPESGRFSVCGYRDGRLVAVETLNRPADHQAARRLLQAGVSPDPALLSDHAFDLKDFAKREVPSADRVPRPLPTREEHS